MRRIRRPGHEQTLRLIERAEELGFDSVWVRQRHLQPGISSPVALLAAASQRTNRIALGTAVIPLGLENPLRLAEDLATIDILSGGRLNPGVSVGTPLLYEQFKTALYPETHDMENFSKERVLRLLACLRGDPVSHFEGTIGQDRFFRQVQPHSPVWPTGSGTAADCSRQRGRRTTASTTSPPIWSALKEPDRVTSRQSRLSTSTCSARTIPLPNPRECHRDWW